MVRPGPVAELLEHLGRRIYGACFAGGLKPAQWSALRYLQRANASARSVTAFAAFHATTKSAASQTIRLLVRKGLVSVVPHETDSRRKRLDLTPTGRSLLANDPLRGVVTALAAADPRKVFAFAEITETLIREGFGHDAGGTGDPLRTPGPTKRG